jgi:hypothetical protein
MTRAGLEPATYGLKERIATNAVVCDRAFDRGEPGRALGKKIVGMLTGRGHR